MSQPWPVDPIGGDSGWLSYSFWLVTATNRQGVQVQATMFAVNTTDATNAFHATMNQNMFGPFTIVSVVPTTGTGIE